MASDAIVRGLNGQPRSLSAQSEAGRRSVAGAGLGGAGFEFFKMCHQLFFIGPALQIEAGHFIGPQGRFSAGPECRQ